MGNNVFGTSPTIRFLILLVKMFSRIPSLNLSSENFALRENIRFVIWKLWWDLIFIWCSGSFWNIIITSVWSLWVLLNPHSALAWLSRCLSFTFCPMPLSWQSYAQPFKYHCYCHGWYLDVCIPFIVTTRISCMLL